MQYLNPWGKVEPPHTPNGVLKLLAFAQPILAKLLLVRDELLGRLDMVGFKLNFLRLSQNLLCGDLPIAGRLILDPSCGREPLLHIPLCSPELRHVADGDVLVCVSLSDVLIENQLDVQKLLRQ